VGPHYTPIPNTDPPKHKTKFDDFTDRVLPPLQEGLLQPCRSWPTPALWITTAISPPTTRSFPSR
jgi:hypothetical protein